MGWTLEGGQPIDRRAVINLLADHAHLLGGARSLERLDVVGGQRAGWLAEVAAPDNRRLL